MVAPLNSGLRLLCDAGTKVIVHGRLGVAWRVPDDERDDAV